MPLAVFIEFFAFFREKTYTCPRYPITHLLVLLAKGILHFTVF